MHSAIYTGWVRHCRHVPRKHVFGYRLFMIYLDLAELDDVFKGRWFWSASRRAIARFDRRDHLGDPAVPLDEAVRSLVAEHTGTRPAGPIRLLTHLRYFGHVFNPVSLYYCFGANGQRVETVVAEVNNTPWGERHCYVVRGPENADGAIEASSAKAMHVSPFHPMSLEYRWHLGAPGNRLDVRIALMPAADASTGRGVFHAAMSLERRPISAASLAGILLRFPFMTLKVIAAIHWEALRLWLKRVPLHDHPLKTTISRRRLDE
ncbi:MAG TPA: DUF1365 domain-containing protein [Burkholderiaceae bacterium]|nr:DUF1365 domain-containing protein [Burkholderiaceae bacterium]